MQTETPPPASDQTGDPGRGHSHRRRLISALVGCVLAVALMAVLFDHHSSSGGNGVSTGNGTATQGTVTDVAPGIDTESAALMQLNVISKSEALTAPPFSLLDQHGQPVSLSQFRGKVVVWSLNDDKCTDLCTLFAEDVIAADKDLGAAAKDVEFVSVNANPFYPSPAATLAWSETNDVESLPNWVYVTGTPAQLEKTWAAYKVNVIQDTQNKTVTHDASVQFIDPSGKIRALGYFDTGSISTAYYGHALAQMADDLLPQSKQVNVGGPDVMASATKGATIGNFAPGFSLRSLSDPGQTVSLKTVDSKPLVLNFWSSTCSVCVQEMPALQKIYDQFDGQLNVVGVDVADPRSAAAAFASKVGVRYPLIADPDGTTAASYKVDALPVTFIISPGGSILARHEGGLTQPQLAAVLEADFQELPQS